MPYTLSQARKLLTQTELQLFEASRGEAIKSMPPKQLAGKVARARMLRDKFRDLYRRQAVATSRKPAAKRSPTGGDNARTEQKAEIFAEVLTRFEAQLGKAIARAEREAAAKARVAEKKAAEKAKAAAKKEAEKTKAAAQKDKAKAAKSRAVGQSITALAKAVKKAAQQDAAAPAGKPASRTARTGKAKAAAPTDVPAVAEQRLNPLKEKPIQKKMHAGARASKARVQAKRDGR